MQSKTHKMNRPEAMVCQPVILLPQRTSSGFRIAASI